MRTPLTTHSDGQGQSVRLYASPKYYADPTDGDKLKPVAGAIVVTHNEALKRFHVELPGHEWIESTPVDKTKFAGSEVVNQKGRFGHTLPQGVKVVQYDITFSAGVKYDAKYGWTKVIGGVRMGLFLNDWKRTFGANMTIVGNRVTLDIESAGAKALKDGRVNLDPTLTLSVAPAQVIMTENAVWAAVHGDDTTDQDVSSSTGISGAVTKDGSADYIAERTALGFVTSSYPDITSAILVLEPNVGTQGTVTAFAADTAVINFDTPGVGVFGELHEAFDNATLGNHSVSGSTHRFDVTAGYVSEALLQIGIAEAQDIADTAPSTGVWGYAYDIESPFLELTLPGWLPGYAKRMKIVIDKDQVGGATLTDFPVAVRITTDADIGGSCQANGQDIRYTSANGKTLLPYDRENFSLNGTPAATFTDFVKVSSILHTADTYIYLYYDASTTKTHTNETAVWSNDYEAVWHLTDLTDATGNGHTLTAVNTPTPTAAGLLGGSYAFDDALSQYLRNLSGAPITTFPYTFAGWAKSNQAAQTQGIVSVGDQSESNQKRTLNLSSGTKIQHVGQDAVGFAIAETVGTWGTDGATWDYCVGGSSANDAWFVYHNGGDLNTDSSNRIPTGIDAVGIGTVIDDVPGSFMSGELDEIRISSVVRSAGWVLACYNNQKPSSTFYALESQTEGSAPEVYGGGGTTTMTTTTI